MEGKVLVFDNPDDFLQFIETLQEAYNEAYDNKRFNND